MKPHHAFQREKSKGRWGRGREASEKEGKGSKIRVECGGPAVDCLEGGLMAELGLEAARTKARCQGAPLLCLGTLVLLEEAACSRAAG